MVLFPGLKSQKSVLSRTGVWTMGTPKRPHQLLFWLKPAQIALNHVSACITWFQALGASLMQNPRFCKGFRHNGCTKTAISTLIPDAQLMTCDPRGLYFIKPWTFVFGVWAPPAISARSKLKVQQCLLTQLLPEPNSISWQSLPPTKAFSYIAGGVLKLERCFLNDAS